MSQVGGPEIECDTLSDLVSRDVAISVRAMNYASSAAYALNRRVESIREAVVYIGRETIRRWVTLLVMAQMGRKPDELITMTLIRARFMEQLAVEIGRKDSDAFFTVGLFSVLDALMDAPLDEILNTLSLSDELRDAMCEHTGEKGEVLRIAKNLEQGVLSDNDIQGVSAAAIAGIHHRATVWADETVSGMTNACSGRDPILAVWLPNACPTIPHVLLNCPALFFSIRLQTQGFTNYEQFGV